MLPKAYTYNAYLESKNGKQFLGSTEATNPTQAKTRILKQWANVFPELKAKLERKEVRIRVIRGREQTEAFYRK